MDGRSRGIFLLLLLLVAKVLVGGCDLRGNTKAAAAVEINARQKRHSGKQGHRLVVGHEQRR